MDDLMVGDKSSAGLIANPTSKSSVKFKGRYRVECIGADGKLKWVEETDNLVVNEGLDEILDKFWKGSTYTASHFVGLKGVGSEVAGDTMASHAGWTELTIYTEGVRQTLTLGVVSGQSVDNSASKAVFSINASGTIAGILVSTNNTKGGSTGSLISAGDFGASRTVANGDTLNATYTSTAS